MSSAIFVPTPAGFTGSIELEHAADAQGQVAGPAANTVGALRPLISCCGLSTLSDPQRLAGSAQPEVWCFRSRHCMPHVLCIRTRTRTMILYCNDFTVSNGNECAEAPAYT
jgi:hypothetical protein